jgi:hypothetical protein
MAGASPQPLRSLSGLHQNLIDYRYLPLFMYNEEYKILVGLPNIIK